MIAINLASVFWSFVSKKKKVDIVVQHSLFRNGSNDLKGYNHLVDDQLHISCIDIYRSLFICIDAINREIPLMTSNPVQAKTWYRRHWIEFSNQPMRCYDNRSDDLAAAFKLCVSCFTRA